MKLKEKNIKLETNNQGEIKSIKYKDVELLHQGEKWWGKTYPMIWPVIGFSTGFKIQEKNYELPKHGFWKELNWDTIIEDHGITMVATHMENDVYPFTIDIQQRIAIKDDSVIISTIFTNLSKDTAYFHFGHHPAFKINDDTKLITNNKYQSIDLDGSYSRDYVKQEELMNMKFGIEFDTLVSKDVEHINETIQYQNLEVTVKSDDFDNVQVWKPKDAKFVCIEPWQGWGDKEYGSPSEAKDKIGIIKLPHGISEEFEIFINVKEK